MFIAVDDTDSKEGMCTTFLVTELIKEFQDYDLLDLPRLVRLNPNVPWKTRGNGAIVITLGKGKKRRGPVGHIGKDVDLFQGIKKHGNEKKVFERAKNILETWAEVHHEETNPGLVVAKERPPESFYQGAVKDVLRLDLIEDHLENGDYIYQGYGKKRGLIGATAALSWRPDDFTYELLTYRKKDMWGRPRIMNEEYVIEFDKKTQKTFDCYDHEEEKQAIAPTSPCPVLYGVRGEDPEELKRSLNIIDSEEPERWILFLTNQGTDDHIQKMNISETKLWVSAKIKGKVTTKPHTIQGGHVIFDLKDKTGEMSAAAYEPTKGFRRTVEKLIPGDKVELLGGIRNEPKTLNIEKMNIIGLENKTVKESNPECPKCGKNMSSMGTDAGYRCKRCRIKAHEDLAVRRSVQRELTEGWYEVPVSARRHLSKPLIRDNICRSTSRLSV